MDADGHLNPEGAAFYHQLFAEFLDTVDIGAMIDETCALIASYVEKDPTAFCSYEEFETGVAALRSFCEKRTESVRGQLEGTIPSTDEGQKADSSALVDASALTLSDMGSMGGDGFGGSFGPGERPDRDAQSGQGFPSQDPGFGGESGFGGPPSFPQGTEQDTETGSFQLPTGGDTTGNPFGSFPSGSAPDMSFPTQTESTQIAWPQIILSLAVLLGGLLTAFLYKKRA